MVRNGEVEEFGFRDARLQIFEKKYRNIEIHNCIQFRILKCGT